MRKLIIEAIGYFFGGAAILSGPLIWYIVMAIILS